MIDPDRPATAVNERAGITFGDAKAIHLIERHAALCRSRRPACNLERRAVRFGGRLRDSTGAKHQKTWQDRKSHEISFTLILAVRLHQFECRSCIAIDPA